MTVFGRTVLLLVFVACAQGDDDPVDGSGSYTSTMGGQAPSSSSAGAGGAGASTTTSGGTGGGEVVPPSCTVPPGELDALPYCSNQPSSGGGLELVEKWRFYAPMDGTQLLGVPLVANLDDDNGDGEIDLCDTPEVVIQSFIYNPSSSAFLVHLLVLSSTDGSVKWVIDADEQLTIAAPAIFDLNDDGEPEILATNRAGHVIALRPSGELLWESGVEVFDVAGAYDPSAPLESKLRARYVTFSALTAADLDADGSPEVIVGMTVLEADGSLRFEDPTRGAEYGALYQFAHIRPVAADLDGDGQLEVLFGHVGYRADGTELFRLPLSTTPGYSHVADFLGDGQKQVLVQSSEGMTLVSASGDVLWGPMGPSDGGVGPNGVPAPHPAAVADLLGDERPEVLINTDASTMVYQVTHGDLLLVASIPVPSPPALLGLGSSAFDFQGDGFDWVGLDATGLTVFTGAGPEALSTLPYSTVVGGVFPVIADIDRDGSADVLLRGSSGHYAHWVAAYEDLELRPSPARRIWNQWNYTSTAVREDARLPPSGADDNTFRVQARLGCQPVPVAE